MSDMQLSNLTARDRTAVREFVRRLYAHFPGEILQTVLFGSKARGDSGRWSDIDILVVVREESWELRGKVSDVGSEVSLKYDVLIGPRVIGRERWEQMKGGRFAFYRNIESEGISLTNVSA